MVGRHIIDEIGNRYGRLVVISEVGRSKSGHIMWKCLCKCGNYKIILGTNLRGGRTQSCGCLNKELTSKAHRFNLIEQKFGRLTVIEYMGKNKYNKTMWKCRCDCGNYTIVIGSHLRNGNTQSCGCLNKERILEVNKGVPRSKKTREKISIAHKGKVLSEEHKKKISDNHAHISGENHSNWKGGITSERSKDYKSQEYKEWYKSVFKRDNYTCQMCGERGGKLEAHHILPWADFKEFRHNIFNGITLCKKCHLSIKSRELKYVSKFLDIILKEKVKNV